MLNACKRALGPGVTEFASFVSLRLSLKHVFCRNSLVFSVSQAFESLPDLVQNALVLVSLILIRV